MGPDGGENIRLDEEGNIALDRVIDDDGNPVKNYPLAPDPRDRRSEFENALMHAYMTKLAIERGEPLPPRKYQSEAPPQLEFRLVVRNAAFTTCTC